MPGAGQFCWVDTGPVNGVSVVDGSDDCLKHARASASPYTYQPLRMFWPFSCCLGHAQQGRQLNRRGQGALAPQQQRAVVLALLVLCPLALAMGLTGAPLLLKQSLEQMLQGACQT
jgi:hypothetical protein